MLWSNINPNKPLTLVLKSLHPQIPSTGRDDHPLALELKRPSASAPRNRGGKFTPPSLPFYVIFATCHQNAADPAAKSDNSGTQKAEPRDNPVNPAPKRAANKPKGLPMAQLRPPDQLQFQPVAQGR